MTIAIIEDEFVIFTYLRKLLQQCGYSVLDFTSNFSAAIDLISLQQPDIIFTDINIQGKKSGIDVISSITGYQPQVIFMSSHYSEKNMKRINELQPKAIINKPFCEELIMNMVKEI